jgi:hypothetical protein
VRLLLWTCAIAATARRDRDRGQRQNKTYPHGKASKRESVGQSLMTAGW